MDSTALSNPGNRYYCKATKCGDGSQQIPLIDNSVATYLGCTKLQQFPYAVFGACKAYERVTLATTSLRCADCTDSLKPEPFCKTPDKCDAGAAPPVPDNAPDGLQVKVDGVDKCALLGIIAFCNDYVSITTDGTKVLGACKTCQTGYVPAISVTNANLCIPTSAVV